MVDNRIHARQAAAALLKMAKTTSDPKIAAGLVDAAADLKDHLGELQQVTEAETNGPSGASAANAAACFRENAEPTPPRDI